MYTLRTLYFIKESHCVFLPVPIRSNIPVREFPEYVMEMTAEDECSINRLAREFSVRSLLWHYFLSFHNLTSRKSQVLQLQHTQWLVCLTMKLPTDLGTFFHVR